MKKILIGILALFSLSALAAPYKCTFTLASGMDRESTTVKDSVVLAPSVGGHDVGRLKLAHKSVKVELSLLTQTNFKGQMSATAWLASSNDVGEENHEGFISGTVSVGAKAFQLSSVIKGLLYNLACRKMN